ncbi:MAG: conjugal transfer protein TraF [Gammaproteobacteria bacterium]|nr:conjugal transfer protein TraF [Gammaproteobacteria bacterium]MBT8134859.1 conjugal transfer protein TraF [Gammaproteobacteria bacterium]NNJ51521.1 conjugal transfer protein TraF [Gammaproteobacteria bacterium]
MKLDNKINGKILTLITFTVFSHAADAVPFAFEGRSLGMGGVSTATADLATAAWANPAMLTNQRPDDDFSLLIGVGAFLRDNDDLISDIDAYQAADDRRQAAQNAGDVVGEATALVQMSDVVNGIEGKDMAADISGLAAMGIAFDSFAMALSIRADAIGAGTVTDLACELFVDPGCDLAQFEQEVTSDTRNILNVEGVLATEFGVSFAKAFQLAERKLSVGIKPKLVDLQAISYRESIRNVDGFDSLTDQDNKSDLGTFSTVDLGLAYDISDSFRLGLNLRNLITDEFKVGGATLNFDTEARLGVAYYNSLVTVAVDYDLRENKPLLANPVFDDLKTQLLAVGAEFNAFDFAQLRIGARKNVASGIPDGAKDTALTAGVGFWLGFNLDIAAVYSDSSVGAFVQTGFRF